MLVLSPFFLLLVLAIKLDLKRTSFVQNRSGSVCIRNTSIFWNSERCELTHLKIPQLIYWKILSNGLQRLGNFLGRTLWMSCLRFGIFFVGDMSIIGSKTGSLESVWFDWRARPLWSYWCFARSDGMGSDSRARWVADCQESWIDGYYVQHLSFD